MVSPALTKNNLNNKASDSFNLDTSSEEEVWTPPARQPHRSANEKRKSFEKFLDGGHAWVDNTFNVDLINKLSAPLESCVDKIASCSQSSLCNSASTNRSINVSSGISKGTSYGVNSLAVKSLNLTCKSSIEIIKIAHLVKFEQCGTNTKTSYEQDMRGNWIRREKTENVYQAKPGYSSSESTESSFEEK